MIEQRRLSTPVGRASFSILLFQDLAVVPILFMLGAFGAQAEGSALAGLALAFGKALLAIAAVFVVGRLVLRRFFRLVSQTRSADMFMAAVLLVVIGTASLTGLSGLSMALGAFLAGLLLGETEYSHEIEIDIEPFKGLMLALFFMSVGMGIDYRLIGDELLWISLSVAGLFALKCLITAALCMVFGQAFAIALETGLLLGQGGEFAFVVIGLAMYLGLVPGDVGQFILIVAGLSMMATPLVAAAARWLAARIERQRDASRQDGAMASLGDLQGHVILAGFGRVGQLLGRIMDCENVSYIALDPNAMLVSELRSRGLPVYYGDASRPQMLHRARAESAAALVLTMDDAAASERVAEAARREWPNLPILARARDPGHAARLLRHGASAVVPETVEASLQLGIRLLSALGISEEVCTKRIEAERLAVIENLKT
ncbi:MAG: potassium transporter [Alphaproteobacteria bacterium]|nr:MAG: potassium transporter [Alphaproteobacteria bacterium]